jgi:hypothetical protein
MKLKNIIACTAGVLLTSLSAVQAANTLTAWTFDNLAIGFNSAPAPSAGLGSASAYGLGGGSNPDVQSLAGSSTGSSTPNAWRVRATGASIGWSTNAGIGSQGAIFTGSTVGFYQIQASVDVYATADAEANLQVQYTTDGTDWSNATVTAISSGGTIQNNSNPANNIAVGSYVSLAAGWNNGITVSLAGISGVDNNPHFAIRFVNAATGSSCVTTTGSLYNNTSGDWTFDNVTISGVSIDTIADWTFTSPADTNLALNNPLPDISSGNPATAAVIGFNLPTVTFADGSVGSTNYGDVTAQAGSSTPNNQNTWRLRGNGTNHGSNGKGVNNGWFSGSPVTIGSQGAEFDVSTVNYNNVILTFDLTMTTQGEAKMCVLYTTNGWITSSIANSIAYGANPNFIFNNDPSSPNYSANTVGGNYFWQNLGAIFYNNIVVDFTGVPNTTNNPNFGVRIVNAAIQGDCINFLGQSYNNSSGNCRLANVAFGGQFSGTAAPALSATNGTVDQPFTVAFTETDSGAWRHSITAVFANGQQVPASAITTNLPGQLVFNPANASGVLTSNAFYNVVVFAQGYGNDRVSLQLAAGVATQIAIIQPTGPTASGGTLVVNPSVSISDQYGNGTTNPYNNLTVTAAVGGAGGWTLGGDLVQPIVGGSAQFTNLSATVNGATAVSGATIVFTVTGYTNAVAHTTTTNFTSVPFNIGAPPALFTRGNLAVMQIDTTGNNTTFSFVEVNPNIAGQTTPANIIPISATTTNALRQSSAGTTGRLALSGDGTLLVFAAFIDNSSATPDETLNLNRGVGTLNYTNLLNIPLTYTSISLGGSQARAAATLDDISYFCDDKGGLYYGSGQVPQPNVNSFNNVVVKTFGGVPYVETQKTANGSPIPVVYALGFDTISGLYDTTIPNNLTTDPIATDFYMVSTNGGSTYDILYTIDQSSATLGYINKYSWVAGGNPTTGDYGWVANGSLTNATGGDTLFATTNGVGGTYLFFTTGSGGTSGNKIVRVTDAAGWNQTISITSSNVIYTTPAGTSLKGLTFVPQPAANTQFLTPTPLLAAQSYIATNTYASFTITNFPDDSFWRSNLTSVTVNGSPLPVGAYSTNVVGKIVFNPSASALLQSPGVKTIGFGAAGYSSNSVTVVLVGAPAQLAITTQPKTPAADGGVLATQPAVVVQDSIGNTVTTATPTITAQPGAGAWIIGGTTNKAATAGAAAYSGLTAFAASAVSSATITFTAPGLMPVTSSTFKIPAPILAKLTGGTFTTAGKFKFAFTNATAVSFSVLATNNLTVPLTNWPVVGAAVEYPAGSGSYSFTNATTGTNLLFYILRQP